VMCPGADASSSVSSATLYWKKRWNITDSYVRHIIQAAEIIKDLELCVSCDTDKLNEFT
jgi:hypothetical protein